MESPDILDDLALMPYSLPEIARKPRRPCWDVTNTITNGSFYSIGGLQTLSK